MPPDGRLVWLGVETTGPEGERNGILEIAAAVTNFDLEVLGDNGGLVIGHSDRFIADMDEASRRRHESSGLLEESRKSHITLEAAEGSVLEMVRAHCVTGKALLAGKRISRLRPRLRWQLPTLYSYLHYRIIDLGTLAYLARGWYSSSIVSDPAGVGTRASVSVREGIVELGRYRRAMFR